MSSDSKTPYELYLRQGSANYWMRFSLPGQGQIRIGLKTPDKAVAEAKAAGEYQKAVWQAEHNILPGKMSFDKLAKAFLASIEPNEKTTPKQRDTYKSHKGVIQRYLSPFFGNRTIVSLTEPKLYQYLDWRRTYWTTGPGKHEKVVTYERAGRTFSRPAIHVEPTANTMRREVVTLRAVFKFAARHGHISRDAIPQLEMGKETKNKRPSFSNAEINRLLLLAEQRVQEMAHLPKIQYERLVLLCFIDIAVHTGMRPTELHNLNWANIVGFADERVKSIEQRRIRIEAYGKGFAPKQLVPNVEAFGSFINLWDAYERLHGKEPTPETPVFCNLDGQRMQSTKNSLHALLSAAGLKEDAFGRKRTAYSFRHTYASNQIRKGTDIYTLAINMRTSVRMIEMYYSDVVPDEMARQLEGSYE
ncbi:tyrosine-type recombinase/integrase [uncultured Devosia sp.]|uniref:tyrosine-type recombinase/integrase n=1 Tax=uncultured Devosia sp. TaxID=211434 RepID=UPI0035CA9ABE